MRPTIGFIKKGKASIASIKALPARLKPKLKTVNNTTYLNTSIAESGFVVSPGTVSLTIYCLLSIGSFEPVLL